MSISRLNRHKGDDMLKARIFVELKPSVLDPQGKAVTNSLNTLGYNQVADTRISKYIEILFSEGSEDEVNRQVEEICNKLLANPNTEHYHYTIEQAEYS